MELPQKAIRLMKNFIVKTPEEYFETKFTVTRVEEHRVVARKDEDLWWLYTDNFCHGNFKSFKLLEEHMDTHMPGIHLEK